MAADLPKKGAARLGVKPHQYWDFIPVRNSTVPLLHILIGVFNDVDDYVMHFIDSKIIPRLAAEMALCNELYGIDEFIKQLQDAVNEWAKSIEGQKRSKLVTRKNKMEKQMKNGQPVDDMLTL